MKEKINPNTDAPNIGAPDADDDDSASPHSLIFHYSIKHKIESKSML